MIEIAQYDNTINCIKTASPLGGQAIMWVYAYQIGDTIFDAGCWNAVEELRAYTKKHPVNKVYVTHNHEDHYGGCAAFLPKAEVFAGPITLKSIYEPYPLPEFFQFVWGLPKPITKAKEFTATSIDVGDFSFEIVNLSGHCDEMIGFWEADQRWFFSSDAVPLPSKKQMAMLEENIPKMVKRMQEIQAKKIEVLFDGHRGPITNPREHIDTRIQFLLELQRQVQALSTQGKTVTEIKATLGFPEPWYLPNTEGRFAIEHLIRSLIEDTP
jgi:glyoxylase-like metal-dependent hydrolase (beta-lactamase superfamily II)